MRLVLILLGGLVAIVVLVLIAGALLPRDHQASGRAVYPIAPDSVWAVLADFASWPSWNSTIERMERLPGRDGKPAWNAVGKWGAMPWIVDSFDPPTRIVTRIPEDAGQGFWGSWSYDVRPVPGGGTEVTITERGSIQNPLFRVISRLRGYHATLLQFLRELGDGLGAEVRPEKVAVAG